MSVDRKSRPSALRHWPLVQLILARLREFYREPEAVFWVYGFPILMVIALGIAFRNRPIEQITVDIEAGPGAEAIQAQLAAQPRFVARVADAEACRQRLRTAKIDLVIAPSATGAAKVDERTALAAPSSKDETRAARNQGQIAYRYDPARPESVVARNAVDDVLQRAAGRTDPLRIADQAVQEAGGRYVDFLIPGLLGMSLMGGGLWGVGYVTVDMRIRKLLKRFLATPMKKRHFLGGIMVSRLIFLIPEVLVLLLFGRFAFGVAIQGRVVDVIVLILLGAAMFAGIGLLVASRARTVEAVSGLMNLVMLPMWVLSGIFFSSERFPAAAQPVIQLLPLTLLNHALRAVMQEGQSLAALGPQLGLMAAWGIGTFLLALRWFRWT